MTAGQPEPASPHLDCTVCASGVTSPHGATATAGQAALAALVDGHFFSDGPHPLQLVCMTEDDNDVECNTWVAEVEPGVTWNELEHRMAEHALAHHFTAAVAAREPQPAPDVAARLRAVRADEFARVKVRLCLLVNSLDETVKRGSHAEEFDQGAAHASAVTARQLREILNDTALGVTPHPAPELAEVINTAAQAALARVLSWFADGGTRRGASATRAQLARAYADGGLTVPEELRRFL